MGNPLTSSVKTMMCRVFFGSDTVPSPVLLRPPADDIDAASALSTGNSNCNNSSISGSSSYSNIRFQLIAAQLYISDICLLENETISYVSSLTDID